MALPETPGDSSARRRRRDRRDAWRGISGGKRSPAVIVRLWPTISADDAAHYIPTQVIAELFKREGCDGIAYKSVFGDGPSARWIRCRCD